MQNQTLNDFVLISIPSNVLEEAGIQPNALIQYQAEDGKIIMEAVDEMVPLVCSGECEECPVKGQKAREKKEEEITLLEFLNNLSEEQQRAALIHLSVSWAQKVGGDFGV